jgi:hypothetical protein
MASQKILNNNPFKQTLPHRENNQSVSSLKKSHQKFKISIPGINKKEEEWIPLQSDHQPK